VEELNLAAHEQIGGASETSRVPHELFRKESVGHEINPTWLNRLIRAAVATTASAAHFGVTGASARSREMRRDCLT